jgi:hypothetical protein
VATGRAKHPTSGEGGSPRIAAMRERIKAGGHETPYRLRKQLPGPVFEQIKQAGAGEGAPRVGMVCITHNILKSAMA